MFTRLDKNPKHWKCCAHLLFSGIDSAMEDRDFLILWEFTFVRRSMCFVIRTVASVATTVLFLLSKRFVFLPKGMLCFDIFKNSVK